MRRAAWARHAPNAIRRAPRRLRELSASEMLLLAQAPFALPLSAVALRRFGLRRVQGFLSRRPSRRRPPDDPTRRSAEVQRLAWIVKIAGMYGAWRPNCLQRSVVLWWYLGRRGFTGDLRIGVRRDKATGALDFHAWIEHDGVVLNDAADVRARYATFDRAIAPPGARFD